MKRQTMTLLLAAAIAGAAMCQAPAAWADQAVAAVPEKPLDPLALQQGRTVFAQVCSACHTSEPNKNKIGPSLFGVIGRHAGSAPGFDYSDAMKGAPVVWNDETLDRYLADPKAFVPGNKMPYAGVKNDERRKGVIAYLHTLR